MPVYQGMSWAPTWKSLPNPSIDPKTGKKHYSCFMSLWMELTAFYRHYRAEYGLSSIMTPSSILWDQRVIFPFDHLSCEQADEMDWAFEDLNGQLLQDLEPLCPGAILSRVASVAAGAGKRRLFIIGNYVKQRLLRPYHDWSMSILRRLVNDGTYDQTKPLRWVTGFKNVYSFDLKSATDGWPRMVIYSILSELFGHQVASAVVDTGLGMCELSLVPPLVRRENIIIYSVGQPLGDPFGLVEFYYLIDIDRYVYHTKQAICRYA